MSGGEEQLPWWTEELLLTLEKSAFSSLTRIQRCILLCRYLLLRAHVWINHVCPIKVGCADQWLQAVQLLDVRFSEGGVWDESPCVPLVLCDGAMA